VSTTISASLVKELRDLTGAGMMDCKRALEETEGDVEAARTLLRERGMASAGKRAGRSTTEGLVGFVVEEGTGSIVGIGCETEPVSKNDEFQAFAEKLLWAIHTDGPDAVESFDEHCARGIEPDHAKIREHVGRSLMLVTTLAPRIGYDKAAQIAKKAHHEGTNLKAAALALGYLTEAEFDEAMRPERMTGPSTD